MGEFGIRDGVHVQNFGGIFAKRFDIGAVCEVHLTMRGRRQTAQKSAQVSSPPSDVYRACAM